jgi:hypothetical protein
MKGRYRQLKKKKPKIFGKTGQMSYICRQFTGNENFNEKTTTGRRSEKPVEKA